MGKGKKNRASRNASRSVVQQRSVPWGLIAGVSVVVVLASVIFGYAYVRYSATQAQREFQPSAQNPDPSKKIPGVQIVEYKGGDHVNSSQRVAYDKSPPFGGPHDGVWADCTGVVYSKAMRNENLVHSLEHGAVWIAYNPDKVDKAGVDRLAARVKGKPYSMMSPYPGLDSPISLQSWGHQLKLTSPDDPRIDQFITALRQNPNGVYPEVGASCQTDPSQFDISNPPPFDPSPPGPNAVPMNGKGSQQASQEMG